MICMNFHLYNFITITEAAVHKDEWQNRDVTDLNLSIPLLMRNKVPEGYEDDDKLDVSIRPQEVRIVELNLSKV